jgi:hemin uptake protein HemP
MTVALDSLNVNVAHTGLSTPPALKPENQVPRSSRNVEQISKQLLTGQISCVIDHLGREYLGPIDLKALFTQA